MCKLNRKNKLLVSIMLVMALLCQLILVYSDETISAAVKAKRIVLNKSKLTMYMGEKATIKVKKVMPKNASKAVKYKSNKKKIVSVTKKGVVTAKNSGTAKITVTSKTNKKVKKVVKVTVKNRIEKQIQNNYTSVKTDISNINDKSTYTNAPTKEEPLKSFEINNPRTENGMTTWDCIYFGSYWQNDTNGDGKVDKNDNKYPIKWRVLSVNGDDAFLISDKNLEIKKYNEKLEEVTWETCTLRKWLNEEFYNEAFNIEEKNLIYETSVINEDNPFWDTDGGNNTLDKIYLLSIDEVSNETYGFDVELYDESETRYVNNTDYVNAIASHSVWWLRSPGSYNGRTSLCKYGSCDDIGEYVDNNLAVRPVLHINILSSTWSKADTVSVNRHIKNPDSGVVSPPSLNVEPVSTPTPIPTQKPIPSPTARTYPAGYVYKQTSNMVTRWFNPGSVNGHPHDGYKDHDFAIWMVGFYDNNYDSTNDEELNKGIYGPVLDDYKGKPLTVTGEFMYEGYDQKTILLQLNYTSPVYHPIVWKWEKYASAKPNEYANGLMMRGINGSEELKHGLWAKVSATFTIPKDAINDDKDDKTGKPFGIYLYFPSKPGGNLPYREDNTFHFKHFAIRE